MALTGLFLISFLVIHATINAMIFYNDGGETFSHWGHFMGTNPIIRTLEIGLVAGFLIHIADGSSGWKTNIRCTACQVCCKQSSRKQHLVFPKHGFAGYAYC